MKYNNFYRLTALALIGFYFLTLAQFPVYATDEIEVPRYLRYPPVENGIDRITVATIKNAFNNRQGNNSNVNILYETVVRQRPPHLSEEKLITASEGGIIELGDAQIIIPPNALENDTMISITRLWDTRDTGDNISNATLGGGGYRFLPAGTKFLIPATIKIGYDPHLTESVKETLFTYFYNTVTNEWEQLERLNLEDNYVVSLTTHFTDMINGTLTLPEGPAPLNFNINSIKSLEAANPSAGVPGIEGLEPNNNGTASFRIPLDIPQGRAGMTPRVAVTYSSDAGNGIMGRGFNLHAGGSITTDTRWGVPRFNGSAELTPDMEILRDTYLLDGVMLELASAPSADPLVYRPLRESGFEKIERHIRSGDYWTVTDRNGTTRTYGERSWSGQNADKKFIWELEEEQDVFGNTVEYVYEGGGRKPIIFKRNNLHGA